MTVRAVAERLRVSKPAVIHMIDTGRLRASVRTGNGPWRYDVDPESLRDFLQEHELVETERSVRWVRRA